MGLTGLNLPYGEALTVEDLDRIPWAGAKFEMFDGVLFVSEGNITVEDLDDVPDDGHRYELLGGVLVVSPAPTLLHQHASRRLQTVLEAAAPERCDVIDAPADLILPASGRSQPDLMVVADVDLSARAVLRPPAVIVEILSPRTRATDLTLKKELYRADGCPHYWVVDPDEPSVIAWELVEGEYAEVGRAAGEETMRLERPFPVAVTPQRLIER
jgi:Uma2 family endonuclease